MNYFSNNKRTFSYVVGNSVEFYDFTLYALHAPLFATIFFPYGSSSLGLMFSLAVFAAAFVMRPIGSIIFGHIGDKHGRKKALVLSISLMAIATFSIGVMPTVKQVGIVASFGILIARLCQGFSAGGEYGGSSTLLMEFANSNKRGLYGALVPMSCAVGALLASITAASLQIETVSLEAWRWAFIIGGSIAIIALILRLKTSESPQFSNHIHMQSTKSDNVNLPFINLFRNYKVEFVTTIFIGAYANILINIVFVYLNIYLFSVQGMPISEAIGYNIFAILSFIVATVFTGYYSDYVGQNGIMRLSSLSFLFISIPIFLGLQSHNSTLIAFSEAIIGFITGTFAACTNGFMYKLYPSNVRYSGIGIGYCIGMALFGGTAPLICAYLVNLYSIPLMPPIYLMIVTCCYLCWMERNRFTSSMGYILNLSKSRRYKTDAKKY